MTMILKLKSFFFSYDSSSFMDWNQPPKFNVESLVYNDPGYTKDMHANQQIDFYLNSETIQEKGNKLDVVSKVIPYEANNRECASHVLEDYSRINMVKVDILRIQIKVVNKMSKSSHS